MWNRWTSNALVASLAVSGALATPPVQFVDYAWLALSDGHHSLSTTLPTNAEWDAVAIVAPVAPFGEPALGRLTLVTGDIIPGVFVEAVETPQGLTIVWESGRLGEYRVRLTEISDITLDRPHTDDAPVVLRNGDTLDGTPTILSQGVRVENALGTITAPWERIASIRLRPADNQHTGRRVWLRDGGVLTITSIDERPGGFFVRTPNGRGGMYNAGEILAITRGPYRVRPIGPASARDDTIEGDHRLTARGHGVVRWKLTGREIALIGAARIPEDSVQWADALVSVWDGSELLFSSRTRKKRPAIAIGSALSGQAHTLTLSIHPGSAGVANGVTDISLSVIERIEPRDE